MADFYTVHHRSIRGALAAIYPWRIGDRFRIMPREPLRLVYPGCETVTLVTFVIERGEDGTTIYAPDTDGDRAAIEEWTKRHAHRDEADFNMPVWMK